MRPTKEMILRTRSLLATVDEDINQIIKMNDMEMAGLAKDKRTVSMKRFFIFMLFALAIFLPFQLFNLFFV